ncbi:uncharacterized protein TrAFT101_008027 [Trichoderma asperellum]|uniref:Uncharacterized protein n=1 Tax=Trichoderma asperellum (strain ATCC 204424 / CBS 433.97 / NBRC 101777) TaxID=1042311 RepID=A0A2T3Z309_TRIA4|nr:hypothetical protein M441DRAFT_28346 [Trichoderma asperellum CBS 433.97]PTB39182.1 hypothetical protein M441DRAFT_28346 [Trichoderma asperellum CBS 433.97]UKZ93098.1 hypothetical protein TrAFT101_008027 [Trichoderma asperellum]
MTRRGGNSDGTFYFQAWHVNRVVSGESWVQNKGIADFVEQNLSPDAKKWLFVKACVPTKERPGLLVPVSICVKLRAAKVGQDPMDAKRALLQFRNKEYPSIARSYFVTRLRKSLDFFNAFSEGAESDSFLADFNVVKSSKQLKARIQAAMRALKREAWGDIVQGLSGSASPEPEFKAAKFIARRGQDPASNPHLLPATPLQNPLPLPDIVVTAAAATSVTARESEQSLRPRKASDASDHTVGSTDASGSDASSTCSVETTQSSVIVEEHSSEMHDGDAKESSSEPSMAPVEDEAVPTMTPDAEEAPNLSAADDTSTAAVETPVAETPDIVISADSSGASCLETMAEVADTIATSITSSSSVVATRRKMNCVLSRENTQTAYFIVQNSGNWFQYLMAGRAKNAQQLTPAFFQSPIILAATISSFEALKPDGMMQVYFMSQARERQEEAVGDKNSCVVRTHKGKKPVREWVVGSAKISTRALTMHLGKQLEKRKVRLLPAASPAVRRVDSVVGPNNRLIEMTIAPGIPQAVLVSTPHPVEDVREGDIVEEERDDGFVHIKTNIINRIVEEEVVASPVADANENTERKDKREKRVKKAEKKLRSKGKAPLVKNDKPKTNVKTSAKTKIRKKAEMDQKTNTDDSSARADVKTDIKVDANSVPPRKPSKVYTPPFSRKSWRDVEPQEPQVIYDVMSGYDFLQVDDVQVFSFSASSHDMMLRTTPAATRTAAAEESEGIGVWAPPVVGIFSWMWDHLSPGGWSSKATTTAH